MRPRCTAGHPGQTLPPPVPAAGRAVGLRPAARVAHPARGPWWHHGSGPDSSCQCRVKPGGYPYASVSRPSVRQVQVGQARSRGTEVFRPITLPVAVSPNRRWSTRMQGIFVTTLHEGNVGSFFYQCRTKDDPVEAIFFARPPTLGAMTPATRARRDHRDTGVVTPRRNVRPWEAVTAVTSGDRHGRGDRAAP